MAPASQRATTQYLGRYAEPEAALSDVPRRYEAVVVVPAFDERADFVGGLDRGLRACRSLCVIVANAACDASPEAVRRTRDMADALAAGSAEMGPGRLVDRGGHGDLLVIDRAGPGRMLPAGQGVGLARKIGCDWALAAIDRGAIDTPWIHTTDADAALDETYFAAAAAWSSRTDVAALTYPFWHDADATTVGGRALALYELSLRYYALGLASAGSPYAFHSVGSTIAVRASAYAIVRGVPRRRAGEDFYLLNKLAKEGRIATPQGSTVTLRERPSTRTPFGTAQRAAAMERELRQGQPPRFYHPAVFQQLSRLLRGLARVGRGDDVTALRSALGPEAAIALDRLGAWQGLAAAAREARDDAALAERHRRWFDGFRTLRFVHELVRAGIEDLPWHVAIAAADFVPELEPRETLRQRLARWRL